MQRAIESSKSAFRLADTHIVGGSVTISHQGCASLSSPGDPGAKGRPGLVLVGGYTSAAQPNGLQSPYEVAGTSRELLDHGCEEFFDLGRARLAAEPCGEPRQVPRMMLGKPPPQAIEILTNPSPSLIPCFGLAKLPTHESDNLRGANDIRQGELPDLLTNDRINGAAEGAKILPSKICILFVRKACHDRLGKR